MTWRNPFRRRDRQAEIDAEIREHLRMAIQDRVDAGEPPDQARRRVHQEFGSVRGAVEEARAVWRWTTLEQLWLDAREGSRILWRAPALSLTATLLIALVIGGNTTIYSAVHGLLTKPAPGVGRAGLTSIGWVVDGSGVVQPEATLAHYTSISTESRLLDAAAFRIEQLTLTHDDGTHAVRGASVSPGYFATLGVDLARGRTFSPAEAEGDGTELVAVISDRLWQRQFGGADDTVGRAVSIDGHPATVIGIAPDPFQGAWLADATDVWVPLTAFARVAGRAADLRPEAQIDGMVAARAAGASFDEAEAELETIAGRVNAALPTGHARFDPVLLDYTGVAGRDTVLTRYGPRFLAIFSIVTLLTVCIVCANVANLMLARAVARQREMAVRQSFGASRWRILRLLLAESVTLAVVAWSVACLFAYWMSQILPGVIPASESGHAEVLLDFTPDWNVLAYAMGLAAAAAVAFTIAPAVRMWRQDLLDFLKAGERGIVPGRRRATRALVVLQLALSVVLLICAGLGLRSLSLISGADLGFRPAGVALVTIDAGPAAPSAAAKVALLGTVLDAVAAVPGVESASYAMHPPSSSWPTRRVRSARTEVRAERNEVGPGFLATLGLTPMAGTEFDGRAGAGAGVDAVINRHLADVLWPGESAVGRTMQIGDQGHTVTVAGVAPNALIGGYRREAHPYLVLLSARQTPSAGGITTLYARYRGSLESVIPPIRRALREAAPAVPLMHVRPLESHLHDMTWSYRVLATMLLVFAVGSLVIAALGQYAAMAFAVRQRVRDFAVRMAMGASARQVLVSAIREGLGLTGAGLALGLVLGAAAGRAGRSLLHGVTPTDTATYLGVLTLLGSVSLAACFLPALRASRVNPIDALRSE